MWGGGGGGLQPWYSGKKQVIFGQNQLLFGQVASFSGDFLFLFCCFPSACNVYYTNIVVIEEPFCTVNKGARHPPPPPPPRWVSFSGLARRRKYSGKSLQPSQTGASIHFSDWGGGGKSKKNENCVCLVVFYVKKKWFCSALQCFLNLFLHDVLWIFQVVEIIGGGGAKRYVCPPPQDRRLCS